MTFVHMVAFYTGNVLCCSSGLQIIDGSTAMTVSGNGFGTDSAQLTVTIGDSPCVVTEVVDDLIRCTVGSVPAGNHRITVNVHDSGKSMAY